MSTRRRKPPGATARNGYGGTHQARRRQLAPLVASGRAVCARCDEPIHPNEPWDLDHAPGKTGYLGPSHRSCNRAAGAIKTHAIKASRRERPYIWSQRWSDDAPAGTFHGNGDGTYDTSLGNGRWETVSYDEARARYERGYGSIA
jgi:hypothetical protein